MSISTLASRSLLMLLTSGGLASCSGPSAEARLCQGNIKNSLINPETAEFFEFENIDEAAFRRGVANFVWKEHGVAPNERGRYDNQLDGPINDVVREATSRHAQFRSYRMKAASRVGLTVTSNYVCAIAEGQCACVAADE